MYIFNVAYPIFYLMHHQILMNMGFGFTKVKGFGLAMVYSTYVIGKQQTEHDTLWKYCDILENVAVLSM